jgi:cytoskeletal protein RodZ
VARQLARRQRRERLGGIALALLGILVLVIAVFALQHPRKNTTASATSAAHTSAAKPSPTQKRTSAPAPTSSAPTSSASTSSAPARLPLLVLNNTTITGLAERAKQTFVAGGWTVTDTGNLRNEIVSTCAYYDPSVAGAQQAAEALRAQFPAIKRVVPRFAELPAGPIVVVLTPDYVSG